MYTVCAKLRSLKSLKNEDPDSVNKLFDGYGMDVRFSLRDDEVWSIDRISKIATLKLNPATGYSGECQNGWNNINVRLNALDPNTIRVSKNYQITSTRRKPHVYRTKDVDTFYIVPLDE